MCSDQGTSPQGKRHRRDKGSADMYISVCLAYDLGNDLCLITRPRHYEKAAHPASPSISHVAHEMDVGG
jgi:hypothetical protein